jgi:hypothetical protein
MDIHMMYRPFLAYFYPLYKRIHLLSRMEADFLKKEKAFCRHLEQKAKVWFG